MTLALISNWILMLVISSCINCQEKRCSEGEFKQQPNATRDSIQKFTIQYCSQRNWHYLCIGGIAWLNHTLAAVACRQLGYSNQGASQTAITEHLIHCTSPPKAFRLLQACDGTENSIADCGGVRVLGRNELCQCSQVAEITCQQIAIQVIETTTTTMIKSPPSSSQETDTTTLHIQTKTITDKEFTSITNKTQQSPTATNQGNEIIAIALATAFGVLVALVAVVLIVVCLVVYKKRSTTHQQSHQCASTKKNESYSLRQLDDPVYDEASSTQPNYNSQGPTYDMDAANAQRPDSYDYIEHTINTPHAEPANSTPAKMEDGGNDFYDAEQHTYAVVNTDMKKAKKKTPSSTEEYNIQQQANIQDAPPSFTPVEDEAKKNKDDFYDAEEHTYSAVNVKRKKKGNKETTGNVERERDKDY